TRETGCDARREAQRCRVAWRAFATQQRAPYRADSASDSRVTGHYRQPSLRAMHMTDMPRPARPILLHRYALSGHAHRAELLLSLLGLPFEKIEVDLARGEQKTPQFLALNPFGQVPVIEDGEVVVADSNAILTYLALRYDPSGRWLPRDPLGAAKVQRWLSVA